MFYASAAALRRVAAYVATTRADAVRRARRHRRYEQVPGKLVITRIGHGARPRLAWRDEHGRAADAPLGAISPADRMRLFTEGEGGLEPLWLWLGRVRNADGVRHLWPDRDESTRATIEAVFAARAELSRNREGTR